jgi:hypothetical protein
MYGVIVHYMHILALSEGLELIGKGSSWPFFAAIYVALAFLERMPDFIAR